MILLFVADEGKYLFDFTKYAIMSAYKYEPTRRVVLFLYNYSGKHDSEIRSWNKNVIILKLEINIESKYVDNFKYCYKLLVLSLAMENYKESIVFLDGDLVLRKDLKEIEAKLSEYDFLIRYRPSLNVPGPETHSEGAIINSGVMAFVYNERVLRYLKQIRRDAISFLKSGRNPIKYSESNKNILTALDQELPWNIYTSSFIDLNFFPLDDKFNDSYFRNTSVIWHAKGTSRQNKKYKQEILKYNRPLFSLIIHFPGVISYDIKYFIRKILKRFLFNYVFHTNELKPWLANISKEKCLYIINSNYLIYNRFLKKWKNILCFDVEPSFYYMNERKLSKLPNIQHYFVEKNEAISIEDEMPVVISDSKIDIPNNPTMFYQNPNTRILLNWHKFIFKDLKKILKSKNTQIS